MHSTRLKIMLDLDGVIADWLGHATRHFKINTESEEVKEILCSHERAFEKLVDSKAMWKEIDACGSQWWEDIPLLPWGKFLYSRLLAIPNSDVCFLSQPGDDPSSAAGKTAWIRKHFGKADFLLGASKHFCASPSSVLIDDSTEKIHKFMDHGGHGIVFPNSMKLMLEADDTYGEGNDLYCIENDNVRDAINAVEVRCRDLARVLKHNLPHDLIKVGSQTFNSSLL